MVQSVSGWGDGEDADRDASGEEQLVLADEEESLPWLEADDEESQPAVDTGRIVAVALAGLVAVAAIVGVLWWVLSDGGDPEIVPDGSTIEAPEEPYKTRPEDPGGREVEGTGATSFQVSEGERPESQIASESAGSKIQPVDGAESESGGSGVVVQVGAFSTREGARSGWNQLRARFEALQGRDHRIVEGTADSGTIYRLQALTSGASDADTLCRAIRDDGGDCQVKR